jgi:quercetin dioxygenase-like cupin family protein
VPGVGNQVLKLIIMKRFAIFLSLSLLFLSGCSSLSDSHMCPTVAAPGGQANVKVEILAESDSSWDGAKLPSYPTEAAQISVVKFTIPPHSKLKWHKHPSMNAGYMISGEILVTAEDGQTIVVKAGDGLIETVNTWHYGRNDSDLPAEIVVVYSGVKDRPLAIIRDVQ